MISIDVVFIIEVFWVNKKAAGKPAAFYFNRPLFYNPSPAFLPKPSATHAGR
jgi:hypothetical protein